ncbi:5-oxoprolinase subunit PxpA [Jeotgalibacillus haloalkalitolerans]|uniref:5-oxoprolinase subunit A n=1 Tax=Jeotgalibacillus haloalkalitolerans TaxID=3104292 RepID=A0ABU5KI76_9BACL|nr:5-oxoprolinase subunit PxpA [Jeotgalibacillus sp. HH7-29]MDZ5710937.1 5-oxoprolinase subunit PxpA [Jeotgalibacillus sp. HH7-29]
MVKIDLNCDMGESFGAYKMGNDAEVLKYITSANIACGYHAGDPSVMRKTVELALKSGTAIGAHPGFPDLGGFGRRNMNVSEEEAYDLTLYQIGALYGFVKAQGGTLQHVKPHGALYNAAAKDAKLAHAIAKAVYDLDPGLILFGLSGGELVRAGKQIGLKTASEVFADRTYQPDGSLTPRSQSNALIEDDEQAVNQVVRMVKEGIVRGVDDKNISIEADTVCIHGDGAHALAFAEKINQRLREENISMQSLK